MNKRAVPIVFFLPKTKLHCLFVICAGHFRIITYFLWTVFFPELLVCRSLCRFLVSGCRVCGDLVNRTLVLIIEFFSKCPKPQSAIWDYCHPHAARL